MSLLKNKKRICFISSSRAELGIMRNLILELQKIKRIKTELILIGPHEIYRKNNKNINEIFEYKIKNFEHIKISKKIDTPFDILSRSGELINQISKKFKKKKINYIIILGDRYEALICSYCAVICGIPIIHISGGDETFGSYDNLFRHSISQFANLHFATNKKSKKKLIKMDIDPKTIFNYGSLSVENINFHIFKKKNKLLRELNINFKKKNFIVTMHPETIRKKNLKKIDILLDAIKKFKEYLFIFTGANNDEEGDLINKRILASSKKQKNIVFIKSLGQKNYFNLLKYVNGVIGNSSSGVTEVPSFNIRTINIGDRQSGRIKAKSVVNVDFSKEKIIDAIKKISNDKFKNIKKNLKNPYGSKNTHILLKKKILQFIR